MFKVKHKYTDEILLVVNVMSENFGDITGYVFLCVDDNNDFVTVTPNEVKYIRETKNKVKG